MVAVTLKINGHDFVRDIPDDTPLLVRESGICRFSQMR